MKRKDVLDAIAWIVMDYKFEEGVDSDETALRILSYLEDIGMQPPVKSVTLIPDTLRGGMKHSPTERGWDDEEI